jgi:uncharacterized integral membrane protein
MVRLIISIVILVVLAVLLIFNGTFMTPVSLFGYRIEGVPVVVVAIVGFVLGVLYSFMLYLMRFFAKRRSTTIQSKDRDVRTREQEVKEKEKRLEDLAETQESPAADSSEPELPEASPRARRWGRRKK